MYLKWVNDAFHSSVYNIKFYIINAADSDHDSSESDDDFQICDICNGEEVILVLECWILRVFFFFIFAIVTDFLINFQEKKKLLRCTCCGQLAHPSCLDPPLTDGVPADWLCYSCKEKTEDYLQARDAYIAELTKRYSEFSLQWHDNVWVQS